MRSFVHLLSSARLGRLNRRRKRFLRPFIFFGTVAFSIFLGFKIANLIGSVVAFVLIMMAWIAVAACMIAKDPQE